MEVLDPTERSDCPQVKVFWELEQGEPQELEQGEPQELEQGEPQVSDVQGRL